MDINLDLTGCGIILLTTCLIVFGVFAFVLYTTEYLLLIYFTLAAGVGFLSVLFVGMVVWWVLSKVWR